MKSAFKLITTAAGISLLSVLSASAAVYSNDFNFPDGTTNFGDGSTAQGGNPGGGFVQAGQLRLTSATTTSTQGAITIPALANSSLGWTATFDFTMADTPGGNQPADGWSFNYGNIPLGTFSPANPEEGWAIGNAGFTYIAATVDTWQNGNAADPPDVSINMNLAGASSVLADQNGEVLLDGQSTSGSVTITFDPVNGLSFFTSDLNNNANFVNIPLPGFVPDDSFTFGLAARTGGATQDFIIDNLRITTVPEASTSVLAALAGLGLLSIRRRK